MDRPETVSRADWVVGSYDELLRALKRYKVRCLGVQRVACGVQRVACGVRRAARGTPRQR